MKLLRWFRKKEKGESKFPGKRLSIDEILTLDDPTSMIIELSYGLSDKISRSGYEGLSHPEKVLNSVFWLDAEINNGGFDQFFYNSSGNHANETAAALEEIGAGHTAELVRKAISYFPGGSPSPDIYKRRKMWDLINEDISAQWNLLDTQFYKYDDPLEELQVKYMMLNKDEIKLLE
jgi:hypothetical protein